MYKRQAPLRPPPMYAPSPINATVSPRFENIMTRSTSVPWSPAPLDGNQYEKQYSDQLAASHTFNKSSEVWTNNNPYTKSTEAWMINNGPSKSTDTWLNTNTQSKQPELWSPINTSSKRVDSTITSNNSSNAPMIKGFEKYKENFNNKISFCFLVQIKHVVLLLIVVHLVVNLAYLALLLDF